MKVLKEERAMSVKFVKSSVSAYGLAPSDEGSALRLIELCGRTAYKSEDKITEDSAKKFVLMLKVARPSFSARTQQHRAESAKEPG